MEREKVIVVPASGFGRKLFVTVKMPVFELSSMGFASLWSVTVRIFPSPSTCVVEVTAVAASELAPPKPLVRLSRTTATLVFVPAAVQIARLAVTKIFPDDAASAPEADAVNLNRIHVGVAPARVVEMPMPPHVGDKSVAYDPAATLVIAKGVLSTLVAIVRAMLAALGFTAAIPDTTKVPV